VGAPLIGITGFHGSWTFDVVPHLVTGVERVYTDGLLAAGGLPVMLMADESTVDAVLDRVDAVVLTGGTDVEPSRYGAARAPETHEPDRERDAFEIALTRAAVERGVPVLAVCRGNQLVNVALGGTLVQHVDGHELVDEEETGAHPVSLVPGSRLHSLLGADRLRVNSLHHQAVAEVAPDLRVAATSDDGLIEGMELAGRPLLSVQWHPERQTDSTCWATLAAWLVGEARTYAATRTPETTRAEVR
jgi:putative glutamine amidotransferase